MGVPGQFSAAGVYDALERGYFKDLGLDVQTVHINTVAEEMPLLATGQLDFGAGGGGDPAFFNAALHGVDVKIVGPDTLSGPNGDVTAGIMVRKDLLDSGKWQSPKDFKGMTVAVVAPHTLAEYVVAGALAKGGLTLKDINLTTLPFPNTVPAFANKAIDAAFLVEPFVSAATANGSAKMAVTTGDIAPGQIGNLLMISPKIASDRNDVAKRFVVGWLKGQRDYYHAFDAKDDTSLQPAIVQALIKYTPIKDPKTYQIVGYPWVDPNGVTDPSSLDRMQQYYIQTGVQPQPVDLSKVIDTSYVTNAVQQLGKVATPAGGSAVAKPTSSG